MGIYDRPYLHEDQADNWFARKPMVINLIIINVAVFVLDILLVDRGRHMLHEWLDLNVGRLVSHPWEVWRLASYAFVHNDLWHLLFNMYGLWLFGSSCEDVYGRREIMRQYFFFAIVAGVAWMIIQLIVGRQNAGLIGASGAVMGFLVLFVVNFPQRVLLLLGIFPMRAITLGIVYVALDLLHMLGGGRSGGDNTAYEAHLAGAATAFLYYNFRWNLGKLVPDRLSGRGGLRRLFRSRPALRVHDPEDEAEPSLESRVDELLEKIATQGEASLTDDERKFLEDASRRYRVRRGQ